MNNLEINKSDLYSDNNFQLSSIDHLGHKLNRGKDPNQAISILLFDLTPDSKINNLYLLEQMDYMDQSTCLSCLVEDVNPTLDDDDYDTFKRCINKELGIQNLINLEACYLLGKVDHKIPFSKTYNCYALCVNDYIKTPDGFKLDLPESEISNSRYSLKKIKFSRAIKGECKDSLVLSSCMLLLSYIS